MSDPQKEFEFYKMLLESSGSWEFLMNTQLSFLYISPSVKHFTGFDRNELLGNTQFFLSLIHSEDQPNVLHFLENSSKLPGPKNQISFRIFTRTKHLKWLEMNTSTLFGERGEYLGLRGTIHDISELKNALSKIENITQSSQYDKKSKLKLQELADEKERELTTSLLKMTQKNELLQHIKKQLESTNPDQPETREKLKSIIKKIKNEAHEQAQWDEFRVYFEKSHPGFFQRLTLQFPRLSTKDIKWCAYLRLQLNTKEIANLLNITPKSAEVTRVRLRKKLRLKHEDKLHIFLSRL